MNRWIFGTEPDEYSWDRVAAKRRIRWDGIRGNLAQKYMRQVRPGDAILAYHSSPQKAVVGVARAVSSSYPDPAARPEEIDRWHALDVAWERWLESPVSLAALKTTPALATMPFLRIPRLSIAPVTAAQWNVVQALSRKPPPA